MSDDDFFVGWQSELPKADRRTFLTGCLALAAGGTGLGIGLASQQIDPAPGGWNLSDVREWTGIVTASPYAMLRTRDVDGAPRTALLACEGKCGVAALIGKHSGTMVTIRGTLIQRGDHVMIAVAESTDWITAANAPIDRALTFGPTSSLTKIALEGEILDSKCWFGAMNPNSGKPHKACAALCIRGGLPPAFYVQTPAEQAALMILTENGQAFGADLLPFVADPVRIAGTLKRDGDILYLDARINDVRRVT